MGRFSTRLLKLGEKSIADELPTQAAALAYYTALSFAPLVLLTLAAISESGLNLQTQFLAEAERLMGDSSASAFRQVFLYADTHPEFTHGANVLGLAVLFFSASAMFGQLHASLNKIFACPPLAEESWHKDIVNYISRKFLSIAIVAIFIMVSIASLLAASILSLMINPQIAILGKIIHFGAVAALFTAIFTAMFHWLPQKRVSWGTSLIGALWAVAFFMVGQYVIGIYLDQASFDLAYGAAGSLIVLLFWVYYSAFAIFLGAEIASLSPQVQDQLSRKYQHEEDSTLSHFGTLASLRRHPRRS